MKTELDSQQLTRITRDQVCISKKTLIAEIVTIARKQHVFRFTFCTDI